MFADLLCNLLRTGIVLSLLIMISCLCVILKSQLCSLSRSLTKASFLSNVMHATHATNITPFLSLRFGRRAAFVRCVRCVKKYAKILRCVRWVETIALSGVWTSDGSVRLSPSYTLCPGFAAITLRRADERT